MTTHTQQAGAYGRRWMACTDIAWRSQSDVGGHDRCPNTGILWFSPGFAHGASWPDLRDPATRGVLYEQAWNVGPLGLNRAVAVSDFRDAYRTWGPHDPRTIEAALTALEAG